MITFIKFWLSLMLVLLVLIIQVPLWIIDWFIRFLYDNTPFSSGLEMEVSVDHLYIKLLGSRATNPTFWVRIQNNITVPWMLFCFTWWKFRNSKYGCNMGVRHPINYGDD